MEVYSDIFQLGDGFIQTEGGHIHVDMTEPKAD